MANQMKEQKVAIGTTEAETNLKIALKLQTLFILILQLRLKFHLIMSS